MMRSSFVLKSAFMGLLLAGSVACGGGEKPPAQPETPSTADAGEMMPAPATPTEVDAGAPTSATTPEEAPQSKVVSSKPGEKPAAAEKAAGEKKTAEKPKK